MHKYIAFLLIFCLIGLSFCQNVSAETIEWQEEVAIDSKQVINKDNLVKVKPGTKVKFTNLEGELNILGELSASGNDKNPVTITIPNLLSKSSATSIQDQVIIKTSKNLKELEIHPYSVETKEIVDELEAFRKQYAFVWVVLMGIQIYLVLNRSTYW